MQSAIAKMLGIGRCLTNSGERCNKNLPGSKMLRNRGPVATGRAMPFLGGGPLMSGILPAGGPALEHLKREAGTMMDSDSTLSSIKLL